MSAQLLGDHCEFGSAETVVVVGVVLAERIEDRLRIVLVAGDKSDVETVEFTLGVVGNDEGKDSHCNHGQTRDPSQKSLLRKRHESENNVQQTTTLDARQSLAPEADFGLIVVRAHARFDLEREANDGTHRNVQHGRRFEEIERESAANKGQDADENG